MTKFYDKNGTILWGTFKKEDDKVYCEVYGTNKTTKESVFEFYIYPKDCDCNDDYVVKEFAKEYVAGLEITK